MILVLTGCSSTTGRQIDTNAAGSIKVGQTTKAQVNQALGDPLRTEVIGSTEIWRYLHQKNSGSPTLKAFIPIVSMYSDDTFKRSSSGEEIRVTFISGIVSSCKLLSFETETKASAGEFFLGKAQDVNDRTSGTTKEFDCAG